MKNIIKNLFCNFTSSSSLSNQNYLDVFKVFNPNFFGGKSLFGKIQTENKQIKQSMFCFQTEENFQQVLEKISENDPDCDTANFYCLDQKNFFFGFIVQKSCIIYQLGTSQNNRLLNFSKQWGKIQF